MTRRTCSNCRWWQLDNQDCYHSLISPEDPNTFEQIDPLEDGGEDRIAKKWGHPVRRCRSPRISFYERPQEPNHATVCDGSGYKADLITGPKFGCVLHEELEDPEEVDREEIKRSIQEFEKGRKNGRT